MTVSLYSLIYEGAERTDYLAYPYALAKGKRGVTLVLYNVEKYPNDYVAAYIKVTDNKNLCPAALQVAQIVRGPSYPGAGEVMYKIASTVFGRPITSDRYLSTSDSAKKAWAKMGNDSSMQKTELDNWVYNQDNETKTFFQNIDVAAQTATPSSEPKTPSPADDCVLPSDPIDPQDPNSTKTAIAKLGSPDAFQAKVNVSAILANHAKAVEEKKVDVNKVLADGDDLFQTRPEGY